MKTSVRRSVGVLGLIVCVACGCQTSEQGFSKPSTLRRDEPSVKCPGPGLLAQAVVILYQEDGSRYLTEQTHQMCPTSSQLVVTADEPGGRCVWHLRNGQFVTVKATKPAGPLCTATTSQAILVLFQTCGDFVTVPAETGGPTEKIDGQWYEAIAAQVVAGLAKAEGITVTLLRPVTGGRTDRVRVTDSTGHSILAHAFNFQRVADMDRTVPTRIEIRPSGPGGGRLDLEYVRFSHLGGRSQ